MNRASAFPHHARLSTAVPTRLRSNEIAQYCAQGCGRYLVGPIAELDKLPADWTCPVCDTNQLDSHLTRNQPTHKELT